MAALAVMPMLAMEAGGIVAEIDVIDPGFFGGWIEAHRARHRGVAAIGELFQRALTAIRTVDPHPRPSMQIGLRAHALFVDDAA
jgi:hypothetical protein